MPRRSIYQTPDQSADAKFNETDSPFINTARGDIVDTKALIKALKAKKIAGAGLDVYEHEPNVDEGLLELDNISLPPHLGSATQTTRTAMGEKVLENLDAYFSGQALPDQVI